MPSQWQVWKWNFLAQRTLRLNVMYKLANSNGSLFAVVTYSVLDKISEKLSDWIQIVPLLFWSFNNLTVNLTVLLMKMYCFYKKKSVCYNCRPGCVNYELTAIFVTGTIWCTIVLLDHGTSWITMVVHVLLRRTTVITDHSRSHYLNMVYRQWSAMDYHGSSWFLTVIFPWFHLPLR